ncbi:MAG: T9SS type A sorting domain-containing protein, partial [Bacteroidetes bacterium]|nr:T9SS type A sorting domain-containing protein [Bacteroidota bacterium]
TTPNTDILFDYQITYEKGACVLHQLRYVLGDSLFFETLKAYCADSSLKFNSATIADFNAKVNQVSGEDYGWFFNEWIFQPNHPVYQNTYNFQSLGNNQWKVNFQIKQVQTNAPFFKMPVEVLVQFSDATDTTIRFMNDANYQQFSWMFGKKPVNFKFDPDRQIVLKGGHTVVGLNECISTNIQASLWQNTPNPSNSKTHIRYSIDESAHVIIEIRDMLGVVMLRLVDSRQPAGQYDLDLDCSKFSAGNYLYSLSTGNTRIVKKLVIIK